MMKNHLLTLFFIIAAGIAAYSNSIDGSFHYDDIHSIVENPSIRTLSPIEAWTGNNPNRFIGFYSFAFNYHFNGLKNLRGWHYVNIFLHILCALFLYRMLQLIIQDLQIPKSKIPFTSALLFVVHPLMSEPVNYIQARHVLFYTLFCLSGVLSAILFCKAKTLTLKFLFIVGIIGSVILGGLSKEVGAFYVPALIALYFFVFKQPSIQSLKFSQWGITLTVLIISFLLFWIIPFNRIFQNIHQTDIAYFLTQAKIFWKYVALLIPLSSKLSVYHFAALEKLETPLQFLFSFLPLFLLIILTVWAFFLKKRKPLFCFFGLWAILGLLPYILINSSIAYMVEYKAYLSAIGFIVLISLSLQYGAGFLSRRLCYSHAKKVIMSLFCILAIFCIKETRERNQIWRNEDTLWKDALSKQKNNPFAQAGIGLAFAQKGELDKAIVHYKKALQLEPNFAIAHTNLANALTDQGHQNKAIQHYKKALEIQPDNIIAHFGLGVVLDDQGKLDDAILHYKTALHLKTDDSLSDNHLKNALTNPREIEAYVLHYNKVPIIEPDKANILNNLGIALARQRKIDEAILCFKKALKLKPDYYETLNNLGNAFALQGKLNEAIEAYQKAIHIKPNYPKAHYNLGAKLLLQGRKEDAIKHFKEARKLNPRLFIPS